MKKIQKNKNYTYYIVGGILNLLAVIFTVAVVWITKNFGITINELLYTIVSPMDGADTDFLKDAVIYCLPWIIGFLCFWVCYCLADKKFGEKATAVVVVKKTNKEIEINNFKILRKLISLVSIIAVCASCIRVNKTFKITEYINSYIHETTIYEEHYVSPDSVTIKAPKQYKNVIYIYLESMETTYASVEDGGFQPEINYIPNLTKMARENISFSNNDKLGGFSSSGGTTWTMGALFSTTSGLPFSFPIDGNAMDKRKYFASGVVSLGDILEANNYRQMFLCGSDGEFAGRKKYLVQHGNYEVFDIYSTKEEGYIPEDYFVWWGYEDLKLYEVAKSEITKLAENKNTPFNFTMLTVDTHHINGYVCGNCPALYEEQLGNVLSCADSQIYSFIEWCKQQPFYENTVIILSGDHPRMDTSLVGGIYYLDRTIYNCFINSDKDIENLKLSNRSFTPMDIFPTVLSALNFEIEGNRLGLGTDMFSGQPTLAEKIGLSVLEDEINKYSKYYIDKFS